MKNQTIPERYLVYGAGSGSVPTLYRYHVFLSCRYMLAKPERMFDRDVRVINPKKGFRVIKTEAVDQSTHDDLTRHVTGFLFSFQNAEAAVAFKLKHADGVC